MDEISTQKKSAQRAEKIFNIFCWERLSLAQGSQIRIVIGNQIAILRELVLSLANF